MWQILRSRGHFGQSVLRRHRGRQQARRRRGWGCGCRSWQQRRDCGCRSRLGSRWYQAVAKETAPTEAVLALHALLTVHALLFARSATVYISLVAAQFVVRAERRNDHRLTSRRCSGRHCSWTASWAHSGWGECRLACWRCWPWRWTGCREACWRQGLSKSF